MNYLGVLSADVAHHILYFRFCCLKMQSCKGTGLFSVLRNELVLCSELQHRLWVSVISPTIWG